jgi:hypothetical protein
MVLQKSCLLEVKTRISLSKKHAVIEVMYYIFSKKGGGGGDSGHVESEAEEGEVPDDGELHPLVTVTNINPDEIPDIPPNRFLYRGERKTSVNNRSKMERDPREHERQRRSRIRGITKSGRVIKGRGVFVSMKQCGIILVDPRLFYGMLYSIIVLVFFSFRLSNLFQFLVCKCEF